ncbi:hypothetical protein CAter10_3699 [Collimonas arenae]|nr:hypothetical protein CAter10_3699 [Collimonas arenae]
MPTCAASRYHFLRHAADRACCPERFITLSFVSYSDIATG